MKNFVLHPPGRWCKCRGRLEPTADRSRGLLALDAIERPRLRTRWDGEGARFGKVGVYPRPTAQRGGNAGRLHQDVLRAGAATVSERGADDVADGSRGQRRAGHVDANIESEEG